MVQDYYNREKAANLRRQVEWEARQKRVSDRTIPLQMLYKELQMQETERERCESQDIERRQQEFDR